MFAVSQRTIDDEQSQSASAPLERQAKHVSWPSISPGPAYRRQNLIVIDHGFRASESSCHHAGRFESVLPAKALRTMTCAGYVPKATISSFEQPVFLDAGDERLELC